MVTVVGVRFKKNSKIYYFDPENVVYEKDSNVIVETVRGIELGWIEITNLEINDNEVIQPLKPIIRIATEGDLVKHEQNKGKEKQAFDVCNEKIKKHNLNMKLTGVEYTFDSSKIIFYFTSDSRVDFRELVKDLAATFKARIELRQIGVRDEAKVLNGMGICGRALCCATFLSEFQPVSIKMAKDQNLSLKPSKISGVCGRLMCCLKYEEESYEELNRNTPNVGDIVRTPEGDGEVISVNLLRQMLKIVIRKNPNDTPNVHFFHVKEIEIVRRRRIRDEHVNSEELKGLLD